jgi:polyphenol oxidase
MLDIVEVDGIRVITAPGVREECGVEVAFTGRGGGCSSGPFESLNMSFNVGDSTEAVTSNRTRVADALAQPLTSWVLCRQVHGRRVADAGRVEEGRGAADYRSALPRTDAMVTTEPGVSVAVLTADCVPVVLVEPTSPGLSVVHAGWRGVLAGVVEAAALRLRDRTRAPTSGMLAFVGPHIGICCMEVGEDVADLFAERFDTRCVTRSGAGTHVDLDLAVDDQLASLGIRSENVFHADICTCCSEDYFSFRRDPACGRQATIARIVPGGAGGR